MTRTSSNRRQRRPSKKHCRPQVVNLREMRRKPKVVPPRVIYVQQPYYNQMECGSKTVEARPNHPCLRDLVPGTLVEFSNRYSGRSFLTTIKSRRVHRDFVTMLRAESIKDCLPDHLMCRKHPRKAVGKVRKPRRYRPTDHVMCAF